MHRRQVDRLAWTSLEQAFSTDRAAPRGPKTDPHPREAGWRSRTISRAAATRPVATATPRSTHAARSRPAPPITSTCMTRISPRPCHFRPRAARSLVSKPCRTRTNTGLPRKDLRTNPASKLRMIPAPAIPRREDPSAPLKGFGALPPETDITLTDSLAYRAPSAQPGSAAGPHRASRTVRT